MERKYNADNLEWMQDWDWDENQKVNNDPRTLTIGSRKRVFYRALFIWNIIQTR